MHMCIAYEHRQEHGEGPGGDGEGGGLGAGREQGKTRDIYNSVNNKNYLK